MSEKLFSPGEIVEDSGLYPVVGPDGTEKGYEVTVVQGEPFPPTPEKGWGFGEPRLAKTSSSLSASSESNPTFLRGSHQRPVFKGNPALVPSKNLPEGRPILQVNQEVCSVDHLPLHRPVFCSNLEIVAMHGDRPVIRLDSSLTPSASLPGRRPIATERPHQSNAALMGYLD